MTKRHPLNRGFPPSPAAALFFAREEEKERQRRKLFLRILLLGPLLGGLLLGAYHLLRADPRLAVSRVEIVSRGRDFDRGDRLGKTGINDQLAIIQSRAFQQRVLDELPLPMRARLLPTKQRARPAKSTLPAELALRALLAAPVPYTNIITFSFPAKDRELALAVVGAASRVMQQQTLRYPEQHFARTSVILQPRLQALATQVETLEREEDRQDRQDRQGQQGPDTGLAPSLSRRSLPAPDDPLTGRRARKLRRRLSSGVQPEPATDGQAEDAGRADPELVLLEKEANRQRIELDALKTRLQLADRQFLDTAHVSPDLFPGTRSPLLTQLRLDLDRQQSAYALQSANLGPSEPSMIAARAQIESTERSLAAASKSMLADAHSDLRQQQDALDRLRASLLVRQRQDIAAAFAQGSLVGLDSQIEVDTATISAAQDLLAARRLDAIFQAPAVEVVDEPHLEPVPGATLSAQVRRGVLGGAALAIVLITAGFLLAPALWSQQGVEAAIGLPVLSVFPRLPPANDPAAGAFPETRDLLLELIERIPPGLVLLTSALPKQGRSTLAIALARGLAGRGYPVLLLDASFERPSLHRVLSLPGKTGLQQVLAGRIGFDDAVFPQVFADVDVLPAGPGESGGQLQSQQLDRLLDTLRGRYRYLLVDGPLLAGSDALALGARAQLLLLVARYGSLSRKALAHPRQRLNSLRATPAAIVVNEVPVR